MKNVVFILIVLALSGIIIALVANCTGIMSVQLKQCQVPPVNAETDNTEIDWGDCGFHDVECYSDRGYLGTATSPCIWVPFVCEYTESIDNNYCKKAYPNHNNVWGVSKTGCFYK